MKNQIQTIIDKYLDHWIKLGLNYLPSKIDIEMTDTNIEKKEGFLMVGVRNHC
jgi:hypothetical protein